MPPAEAMAANILVLGVFILAAVVKHFNSDMYYFAVQEDQIVEWMTFWSFFGAAWYCFYAAYHQRRSGFGVPWFLFGVGVFCAFVALEEISWGQRMFGFRPPDYFLKENFQQEFNVHNVFGTKLRILALKSIILGYGVFLPMAGLAPIFRRFMDKIGMVSPPAPLIPAFVFTFIVYEAYPWDFSGELVELMLGMGFLFAGRTVLQNFTGYPGEGSRFGWPIIRSVLGISLLGALMVAISLYAQQNAAHEMIEAASVESKALSEDFRRILRTQPSPRKELSCGLHNRIFAHVKKYGISSLYAGDFANLTGAGLPGKRAEFFLDPWNSPYWIIVKCSEDRRRQRIAVYSFGPNRSRDSTHWEFGGDDIGSVVYESNSPKPGASTRNPD